jgi:hypothetical protein
VNEKQGANEHGIGLTLFEVFFERRGELLGVLDEFLFPLLDCLLARCARNKTDDLIDGVQELFNGTCDLSAGEKSVEVRKNDRQLT